MNNENQNNIFRTNMIKHIDMLIAFFKYQKQLRLLLAIFGILLGIVTIIFGILQGCTMLGPDIPRPPKKAVFLKWIYEDSSATRAISDHEIEFYAPSSNGNVSSFTNGRAMVASDADNTGWLVSSNQFALRGMAFSFNVISTGWDCAIGISPTLTASSTSGIFDEANRLRVCFYGTPRKIIMEWRRNGVHSERMVADVGIEPFPVAIAIDNDSVLVMHGSEIVYLEKFDLPGYTIDDLFYLDLEAHKTPTGGGMIIDHPIVTNLEIPNDPPPEPPVVHPTQGPIVEWNANSESDLAGYKIYFGKLPRTYAQTMDVGNVTLIHMNGLEPYTEYFVAVTAYDSSLNESDFSDEISFITGPADTTLVVVPVAGAVALVEVERDMIARNGGIFDTLAVVFFAESMVRNELHFPTYRELGDDLFALDLAALRALENVAAGDTLRIIVYQCEPGKSYGTEDYLELNKRFIY